MRLSTDRLTRLQRVRELQEEVARAAWLAAELAVREVADLRQGLATQRAQAIRELNEAASGVVDPSLILTSQRLLDGLRTQSQRLAEREATLTQQAAALRAPWQLRKTEASALNRLRTRSTQAERAAEEQREIKQMDEVAVARAYAAARRAPSNRHQTR